MEIAVDFHRKLRQEIFGLALVELTVIQRLFEGASVVLMGPGVAAVRGDVAVANCRERLGVADQNYLRPAAQLVQQEPDVLIAEQRTEGMCFPVMLREEKRGA